MVPIPPQSPLVKRGFSGVLLSRWTLDSRLRRNDVWESILAQPTEVPPLHLFRIYLLLTNFLMESPIPSRFSSYMGNSLLITDTVGWFQ